MREAGLPAADQDAPSSLSARGLSNPPRPAATRACPGARGARDRVSARTANACDHDVARDRRQDNRVAARGIDKQAGQGKLWLSAGDVFLRMSPADVSPPLHAKSALAVAARCLWGDQVVMGHAD